MKLAFTGVFVAILSLMPAIGFAQTIGFSKEPVWISRTPVVEGDTVLIHAALANGSKGPLTGTLSFRDNGTVLGTVPINLKVDEARVVSLSWSPKAGKHELAVELASQSEEKASRTEVLSVTVSPKAQPAAAGSASVSLPDATYTDSASIQDAIEGVSPKAAEVVSPAFSSVDDVRKRGSDILSSKAAEEKGKVAGLSAQRKALAAQDTAEAKKESRTLGLWQILHTILLYIFETLNLIVSKAGIFYPLLAFGFLFFLWKMWQRYRRPGYDY